MPHTSPVTCQLGIDGLEYLLGPVPGSQDPGLVYYARDGLNVVVSGPAGSGKSLLVLQAAVTAVIRNSMNVIYLSKDTPPATLVRHALADFHLFGEADAGEEIEDVGDRLGPLPRPQDGLKQYREWWLRTPGGEEQKRVAIFCTRDIGLLKGEESEAKRPGKIRFVFLDKLAEIVTGGRFKDKELRDCLSSCLGPGAPVFAVGSFCIATGMAPSFHEDVWKGPLIATLGRICESFRSVFEWLSSAAPSGAAEKVKEEYPPQRWKNNVLIVLDSLPAEHLENCLRAQSERPGTRGAGAEDRNPVAMYVAETPQLPEELVSSFPPDVLIKLGFRDDAHGSQTRTIQIPKSRFQSVCEEAFPFVILDYSQRQVCQSYVVEFTEKAAKVHPEPVKSGLAEPTAFMFRQPGITILPSMMEAATCHKRPVPRAARGTLRFANEGLDGLTTEGGLAGGGCTLLATENRCHSTPLGLHFLLGEIAEYARSREPRRNADVPRSVLYLALDEDLPGVLHDIWRCRELRKAIWGNDWDIETALSELRKSIGRAEADGEPKQAQNRLYKIRLRHGRSVKGHERQPLLYIFTPDLVWSTPEELLERIGQVLAYAYHNDCPLAKAGEHRGGPMCLAVDRVLFNRVSRVKTRWPLVRDTELFVSCLAQMCRARGIELMVIDDTAQQSQTSGHISSHWISIAQNIIRLKRVPFHGAEAVAMELVRSHGRSSRITRPLELRLERDPKAAHDRDRPHEFELRVRDSFRGYTGLLTGTSKHCQIRVEIPYDRKDTPLFHDMMSVKANLGALMEGIEVHVAGPEERPGVNSALSNLSRVTRDKCIIAGIDEIWIHRIIGNETDPGEPGLAQLPIHEVCPELLAHVRQKEPNREGLTYSDVKDFYVTEAMTIACKKAGRPEALYAVPFRHNWQVLAVARPRKPHIGSLFDEVLKATGMNELVSQLMLDAAGHPFSQQQRSAILGLLGVLRDDKPALDAIPDDDLGELCLAVRAFIWSAEAPGDRAMTWGKLRKFKIGIWDTALDALAPFNKLHDLWRRAPGSGASDKSALAQALLREWFSPATEINFFDFERATAESATSVLMPLFLAHCDWSDLFLDPGEQGGPEVTRNTASLLYLRTDAGDNQVRDMADALLVLYDLLSPRQRREIAIGAATRPSEDLQKDSEMLKKHEVARGTRGEGRPKAYTLFAVEWLSSVPELGAHHDLREQIVRKHLPSAQEDPAASRKRLRRVISQLGSLPKHREEALMEECEGKGPSLSGTWYLGTLSGGNVDVATDVIRELVSEYHERDRMITGGAAPVTRRFYQRPPTSSQEPPYPLYEAPYAGIMRIVYGKEGNGAPLPPGNNTPPEPGDSRDIPTFPFSRTRILEYTSIALELGLLLRQVMGLQESAGGTRKVFERLVQDRIKQALGTIRHQIYFRRGYREKIQRLETECREQAAKGTEPS